MDVNRTSRVAIAGLCLAMLPLVCFAQERRPSYDPTGQAHSSKPKDGFVDFALKSINPSDKDYGQCLDASRKILVDETVRNGYFWSNVVTLSLLGCLFIIVVYQHRQRVRREWTIAEILQQYEHALIRANTQVDEATKRNNELSEELTSTRENAFRSPVISTDLRESPTPRATSKRTAETQPAEATAAKATVIGASATPASGRDNGRKVANQMGLFKPEVDLILKVNSLEQQLGRSQEQEKQLRRQLTQADLRLQAEQQKNRTLKGA